MVKYNFENNNFVIESYDKSKTFSSFLPGIAGLKGIPMWVFYVNRGQAVSSFGIQDKNGSILEFSPASITYQNVSRNGFRTFLKISGKLVEAFDVSKENCIRKMYINESQVSISERNEEEGYEIKVDYFGLPQENFAALVRKVEVKNITDRDMSIEIIDGCTAIFPSGVENAGYKAVGNLLRSWMDVDNLENNLPFYKLRSSTGDEAEISEVTKGNFYMSFSQENQLLKPIVDLELIFGYDTSLAKPVNFENKSIDELMNEQQITANKVPCGFSAVTKTLKLNETVRINTLIGHCEDIKHIENQKDKILNVSYIDGKQKEAYEIIRDLTDDINTQSGNTLFDEYARQSYLDNFLRGGYPFILENGKDGFVYHLYSRKHGDLERDYNWFQLAPEYYSQGNGNFRDANQNRRNDVLFNPKVGSFNIKMFMSLIQMDGYNPLSVNGSTFSLKPDTNIFEIIDNVFDSHHEEMKDILSHKFTPGRIINYVNNHGVNLKVSEEECLRIIFSHADQNIEANFGEGYWIDHWTYNMDLIETYLQVYPDKIEELLFKDHTYRYFDSPVFVLPRSEKYVLNKEGLVRQYGSLINPDQEKLNHLGIKVYDTNWLRVDNGKGEFYETNLMNKLLSLATVKFSTLDPLGMGVEMEANKPGWNDAMNGLPGLFGSGVGESFELLRILNFLEKVVNQYNYIHIKIPRELNELINELTFQINQFNDKVISQHKYWDVVSSARESFRSKIRFGITGEEIERKLIDLKNFIHLMKHKLLSSLEQAKALGEGIYPTYLVYEAVDYKMVKDNEGNEVNSHYGLPKVEVQEFKVRALPHYAESIARSMKVIKDNEKLQEMHKLVQLTEIYDKKLKMYKTSESIEEETFDIGRARAFTPGWLEREAIFLHMTYKYVLGLLKGSLYSEFYEAMKTNMIPFLDPEVYGRSTLENSSFIASSVNPNPNIHGQGFFARLTGSTAEFLSMWTLMTYGKEPFKWNGEELTLEFKPFIPGWLFNEEGLFTFKFLGHTDVTYINLNKEDTDQLKPYKYELDINGDIKEINNEYLEEEYALMIRNGKIHTLKVYLRKN